MKPGVFARLMAARAAGQPAALVTRLADHAQCLVIESEFSGDLQLGDSERAALAERMKTGHSGGLDAANGVFARVYAPPPRLLLVGAVHIAQALAPMATSIGYAVSVIDPRSAFASKERFPESTLVDEWPDEALRRLRPDTQTAIVTLTHDPKLDDAGLDVALNSPAFYIGSLGSARTHEKRLIRLRAAGFTDEQLARIHSPIGLNLGGRMPSEIAVAILAEIISVRYLGHGR